MNIIQENIDELNAVLKVEVSAEDYLPQVKSVLKNYQKKASIPGFRPGKVPAGLIEKQYGKGIKVDEIQKLLSDSLIQYMTEKKLNVLGSPLPKEGTENSIDWDGSNFEFYYELGLSPEFSVEITPKDKLVFQTLKIDDALLNKNIESITKRYGKVQPQESVSADDLLYGEFVQLNDAGEVVEGGINKAGSLFLDKLVDDDTKKMLLGKKAGDQVVIHSTKLSANKTDLAAMLGIEKGIAEILNCNIQFTIKEITHIVPAEINQEFLDKVFGPGVVNSEEEFRLKIKDELTSSYLHESDTKFYYDAVDYLLTKVNMNLPDKFLKRYLTFSNRETLTPDQVENDFDKYTVGMKWQLIENKLATENNINITEEELVDYIKNNIIRQYGAHLLESMGDEELTKTAKRVLGNEEEARKIHNELLVYKMKELFKSKFTLDNQEVDYDVFFGVKK